MHIQHGALLQTAKWKYLLISQVCILPPFGRAVTGKRERSDASEKVVYTWFTSEHIRPFGNTVTRRTKMNGTHRLTERHRNTERTEVNQYVSTSVYGGET